MSPFDIVRGFENAVAEYTGAPYVVAVNSCTMALLLACKWWQQQDMPGKKVILPKHTYVGVPMSVIHAGFYVQFDDIDWLGHYWLTPLPVIDSARFFSSGMYIPGSMMCVSFHATKILGDTQGGAILLDNREAYEWLKRMRFDGRTEGVPPKDDLFTEIGYHCYMSPDVAARLLHRLSVLPMHNRPLDNDDYPDLSQFEVFR